MNQILEPNAKNVLTRDKRKMGLTNTFHYYPYRFFKDKSLKLKKKTVLIGFIDGLKQIEVKR